MELYLDSVDFKEIEEAFGMGFLYGLTTTPTFMHRQGITDVDQAIVRLSKMVPVLHVEALGDTADQIEAEAHRLLSLGLDKEKTYFKIPVSNTGVTATKRLVDQGLRVNVHLIYTLNQAYMAMAAGADYLCILAGRFQDQGHNSLTLIDETIDMVERAGSPSKVMFSSVRHAEHVRNAITLGAHAVTVPWGVMKKLTENNFTTTGTDQFLEHTRLLTVRVREVIRQQNPVVSTDSSLVDALVKMTESKFGAVSVVDGQGSLKGIFTDGDLRRYMKEQGKTVLERRMGDFQYNEPITISADALLYQAVEVFRSREVDNIIVVDNNQVAGMLDIQDFVKMKLVG